MDNNLPSKPDPKGKAIASIILGIISILILIGSSFYYEMFREGKYAAAIYDLMLNQLLMLLLASAIGFIALILGIKGLKSTKRYYAMAGIIISALFWIMLFLGVPFALGYILGIRQ